MADDDDNVTPTIVSWVIGGNGLLGTAIRRELDLEGTMPFVPPMRFCWTDDTHLAQQIEQAVEAFSFRAAIAGRWEIYWAAGIGTMSSPAAELVGETQALSMLLQRLSRDSGLMSKPGRIAFASSAGAIYAARTDDVVDEETPTAPTTAYAHEKLRQEELLSAFASAAGVGLLIARISTLYGVGQSAFKQQGLFTNIARRILRNQAIPIFVPYDTIRDYIPADDAAAEMIRIMRYSDETPQTTVKIIASEQAATIAEIISIFRRLVRRMPRVLTSANRSSGLYPRRVQFRSKVLTELSAGLQKQSLAVGIAKLLAAERAAFAQSANQGMRKAA